MCVCVWAGPCLMGPPSSWGPRMIQQVNNILYQHDKFLFLNTHHQLQTDHHIKRHPVAGRSLICIRSVNLCFFKHQQELGHLNKGRLSLTQQSQECVGVFLFPIQGSNIKSFFCTSQGKKFSAKAFSLSLPFGLCYTHLLPPSLTRASNIHPTDVVSIQGLRSRFK